jgi:citrate synthase
METTLHKGLRGITVAETSLSLIDGEQGRLIYRGYEAGRLARERSFEEVAHLLWFGRLPDGPEGAAFAARLTAERDLPDWAARVIDSLPPDMAMMAVLRTAVSALGAGAATWPPTVEQALSVTAKVPTIVARRWRKLQGLEPVAPRPDLGHAANYLHMLTGEMPTPAQVGALEAYLVLTVEHGMNASTFSARVTASTQSDLISAVTTAIGTMKGPLHGGAPSEVADMLEEIGSRENAEAWLRTRLERGERIMGFGHRVYKTRDPRAEALSAVARRLAGGDERLDLATYVEDLAVRLLDAYKPGRRLYTNVEFWAAAVLKCVQMDPALYTPTFTVARTVGWTAHILEQAADNQLIRPDARYVGPLPAEV